jgi:phage baseplate assembly protein gpV
VNLSNFYPGVVVSYDAQTRMCRVRIPGVTDGAEVFPNAELLYPIGDKSEHTDIRILQGDRVVLGFINGDQRHPVVLGFMPKAEGNALDVRRFEHKNIELQADADMLLQATDGNLTVNAGSAIVVKAGTTITVEAGGTVTIKAEKIVMDAPVEMTGTLLVDGRITYMDGMTGTGTTTTNGFRSDETHQHVGVRSGGDISGTVKP